jgi:hypothetical protein
MALIPGAEAYLRKSPEKSWLEELANSRFLLDKLNNVIAAFDKTGIQEYTLDTGQTRLTVKRSDLSILTGRRNALLIQIDVLEARLGIGAPSTVQVVPRW